MTSEGLDPVITRLREWCGKPDRFEIQFATDLRTLLSALDDARAEIERLKGTWPIATDGPHAPGEQRLWLARQLMDSKLTDKEAFGIVCYHPDVSRQALQSINSKGGEDLGRLDAEEAPPRGSQADCQTAGGGE
jgi:hypothetical protein